MVEKTKSLLDQPAQGALAEGAARFERLIQNVKAQQTQVRESPAAPVHNPLLAVSPQEEWSRQFQNSGIGGEGGGLKLSDLAPLPRAALMPDPVVEAIPSRPSDIVTEAPAVAIGAGLIKPERPRRSWLGRMLLRN